MQVCDESHLKSAVHQAHYVVELLMVQDGAVQLHVQTELFGQTLSSCLAFQGTQGRRESLDTTPTTTPHSHLNQHQKKKTPHTKPRMLPSVLSELVIVLSPFIRFSSINLHLSTVFVSKKINKAHNAHLF